MQSYQSFFVRQVYFAMWSDIKVKFSYVSILVATNKKTNKTKKQKKKQKNRDYLNCFSQRQKVQVSAAEWYTGGE
jgi:hypothetical protein